MRPGEDVGRLRLRHVLGSGGFATVWLADDPDLDARVAVKILADNWSRNTDVRERFLHEARLLRRVDAEEVVRVHDVGSLPDGRPYFVMTHAAGGSLADELARGPMDGPRALTVLTGVARGLAALHRVGIVHRDLNPHNVLLTAQGRAMLADLGVAKDLVRGSGLTAPVGTEGYRAPEQLGYSLDVTPATDHHAFGALTRLLVAPPRGHSLDAVLEATADPSPSRRPTPEKVLEALTEVDPAQFRRRRRRAPFVRAPFVRAPFVLGLAAAVVGLALALLWWASDGTTWRSPGGELAFHSPRGWTDEGAAVVPGAGSSDGLVVAHDGERVVAAVTSDDIDADALVAGTTVPDCHEVAGLEVQWGDASGVGRRWECDDEKVTFVIAVPTADGRILSAHVTTWQGEEGLAEALTRLETR